MTDLMRAVSQSRLGGPEVLELVDMPRPVPGIGEILVRVAAAGVNPVDEMNRRTGAFGEPPFVLGWDVSGVVAAVGPGVTIHAVGDEVFGLLPFPRGAGAYAEYAVAPARSLVAKPASLSHVEAAALPLAGLTAWQALVETAGVGAGTRLVVTGAAGGVGHLAVQIAHALDAEVIAVASAEREAFLRDLGADDVVDYRTTALEDAVADVEVFFDAVGGDYPVRAVPLVRRGGIIVATLPPTLAAAGPAAARAGVRLAGLFVEADRTGMTALADLSRTGALRPTIAATYPLADAAAAHREPHGPGKVVLTVG